MKFFRFTIVGVSIWFAFSICIAADLSFSEQALLARQAQAGIDATLRQDAETVIELTHESFFKLGISREATVRMTREMFAQSNAMGIVLERSQLSQPTTIYPSAGRAVCFVPYVLFMRMGQRTGRSIGYLVAIRDTPESKWKFLDSAVFRQKPELLHVLVPGLPKDLTLPKNENQFDQ
jgi:hypothetical protein